MTMKLNLNAKTNLGLIIGFCFVLILGACAAPSETKPNSDQAKGVLKLRGYDFDQVSFARAAAASDEVAVNLFFAAGINPNTKDATTSPLIAAATRGDLDMVKALIQGGALVNQRDEKGFTALLRALQNQEYDVADILLAQPGLDVNAQGSTGVTALMSYAARQREDAVKNLLSHGADVNLKDADGDTALHLASQAGNVNVLRMLLEKGAAPNAKNKVGGTPLMWAGVFGHEEAAKLLLERGADASLKDNKGNTAAFWAKENKRDELAALLHAAEKKEK